VATLRAKFGRRLREIRAQRRMTQEQFAETLDISVDFLSLVERGRNAPSFETLDKIAKRLKMTVADLFTFDVGSARETLAEPTTWAAWSWERNVSLLNYCEAGSRAECQAPS
jgi:transcriptional regulator with XRE-family HTH domain